MSRQSLRGIGQDAQPFELAPLAQNFASLAACISLCVLVASAVFVRWQDMPLDYRWIAADDEVAEVELHVGNAFAADWNSYHTDFDCAKLDARRCARLQDFRSLVARRDFRRAETPPAQEVIMDLSSSTLTVRLRSGKVVKRHIYDRTLNANYNLIASTITGLAEEGLVEMRHSQSGPD